MNATPAFQYARHASDEFNARLEAGLSGLCAEVRKELGENLIALILGGGYGQGEGGVFVVSGEERPYNDLDLILVVKVKSDAAVHRLVAVQHKYEKLIAIQVDFSRPLAVRDIRRWPHTLMWTSLLQAHHVLYGPPDILTANAPNLRPESLPLIEATRLLLNRGAGLLWALRVLREKEPEPDNDFVRRNYYKCALALGDAVLIAHHRFEVAYSGREEPLHRLLPELPRPFSFDLGHLYAKAMTFKFRPALQPAEPDESQVIELARQWGEILLYCESLRTNRPLKGIGEYVEWKAVREPEQNSIRNWPRNFLKSRLMGLWSMRYPREHLYIELPVLLGLCGPAAPDWPQRSARFLAIWKEVN